MSFLNKRLYFLIIIFLAIIIILFFLNNYSYNKKNYILTNEILPKVTIFLIKKNYDKIEKINSEKIEKKFLKLKKNVILNFLKKEKEIMKLNFSENTSFKNLKISTGITIHERIYFNFSFENDLLRNNKDDIFVSEYIKRLNEKFKYELESMLNELDYFNREYVYNNQVHINPYLIEDETKFKITYKSSIILNNYFKYFVSFIYLMLLIFLFLFLKQNFYRFRRN